MYTRGRAPGTRKRGSTLFEGALSNAVLHGIVSKGGDPDPGYLWAQAPGPGPTPLPFFSLQDMSLL